MWRLRSAGALYPLFHKVDTGRQTKVTFSELEDALAPSFTQPWNAIRERLLDGNVHALSALHKVDQAKVQFLQIFEFPRLPDALAPVLSLLICSVGPSRAQAFVKAGCRTFDDIRELAAKENPQVKVSKSQQIGLELREVRSQPGASSHCTFSSQYSLRRTLTA